MGKFNKGLCFGMLEAVVRYHNLSGHEIERFNDDPYPDLFFEKAVSP